MRSNTFHFDSRLVNSINWQDERQKKAHTSQQHNEQQQYAVKSHTHIETQWEDKAKDNQKKHFRITDDDDERSARAKTPLSYTDSIIYPIAMNVICARKTISHSEHKLKNKFRCVPQLTPVIKINFFIWKMSVGSFFCVCPFCCSAVVAYLTRSFHWCAVQIVRSS